MFSLLQSVLPLLAMAGIVAALVFFIYLGTRRSRDIPYVPPKRTGRVTESAWFDQVTFEEFIREHDLALPGNPGRYTVWVRAGSFEIAAVSMTNGDKVAVSRVSML